MLSGKIRKRDNLPRYDTNKIAYQKNEIEIQKEERNRTTLFITEANEQRLGREKRTIEMNKALPLCTQ